MANIKKLVIFQTITLLILFSILGSINAQSPPGLPVNIYGRIISESKMPVEGVEVVLNYVDNNGLEKSISTRTLRSSDVINQTTFPGYYKFEEINAQKESELKITCLGETTVIYAITGTLVKIPDITIKSIEYTPGTGDIDESLVSQILGFFGDIYKSSIGIIVDSFYDNDAGENMSEGGNITSEEALFGEISTYNKNISDNENLATIGANGVNNGIAGEGIGGIYSNGTYEKVNGTTNLTGINNGANVIGTNNDEPVNNAVGINENNETVRIGGDEDSTIIGSKEYVTNKKIRDEKISKEKSDNKTNIYVKIGVLFLILVIGSILLMKFLGHDKVKKKPEKNLRVSIGKIDRVHSRQFMKEEIITLNENDSIYNVIEIFAKNNINSIPITSGDYPTGVVTKKELIKKIKDYKASNLQKIKIKAIMSKNYVTAEATTDLGEVYTKMLEKGVDEVIIINDGKIVGYIDFFDILSILSSASFEIINPPTLGMRMDKTVHFVEANISLKSLRNSFLLKKTEYAIVRKNNKAVGIITLKDLITSVYKELDLGKTKVENVMSTNVLFMDPGTSVTDTFDVVLERRFNQLPIINEKKIVGIVNVKYLVSLYYEFILEIRESSRKIFYGPLDWWKRFNE